MEVSHTSQVSLEFPSPRPKSLREILNAPPPPKLRHHQSWGSWRLDAERLVLEYVPEGCWRYELDLEKNHDAASVLDFIFQFYGKGWATPVLMADLLEAIYDIFDPQDNLCSCGRNRCISPGRFWAARIEPLTEAERAESYRQARQTYEAWGFLIPGETAGVVPL